MGEDEVWKRLLFVASVSALALLGSNGVAQSATRLMLCPWASSQGSPTSTPHRRVYTDAAGGRQTLSVTDGPAVNSDSACASVALPVAPEDVQWLALTRAARAPATIALHRVEQNGEFQVEIAEARETTRPGATGPTGSPLQPTPIETDLLPHLSMLAFGAEERASVESAGERLTVTCRAGTHPAGIILQTPEWRLPTRLTMTLRLTGRGEGRFTLGLNEIGSEQRGEPFPLGDFSARPEGMTQDFALPLPPDHEGGTLAWTLACPASAATLTLTSLRLMASPRAPKSALAGWAWQPERWQYHSAALLSEATRFGFKQLYVTVPIAHGKVAAPGSLASFIAEAARRGIAIWAVEGDPRAVLPIERMKFVARAAAFARYNASAMPAERLAGVQYDVEPYLEPGYALDPASWQRAYVATITALGAAAGMPVEAVLPFWIALDGAARERLLNPLAGRVASIVVMAYRTDPLAIQQFAEPFLAWGSGTGTKVRVALESGFIADEIIFHYRPAPQGALWLVPIAGKTALLLLRSPAANPVGPAFAHQHDTTAPGSRVSFLGDRTRLFSLVPKLEEAFRAWSSFNGLALHGVL